MSFVGKLFSILMVLTKSVNIGLSTRLIVEIIPLISIFQFVIELTVRRSFQRKAMRLWDRDNSYFGEVCCVGWQLTEEPYSDDRYLLAVDLFHFKILCVATGRAEKPVAFYI